MEKIDKGKTYPGKCPALYYSSGPVYLKQPGLEFVLKLLSEFDPCKPYRDPNY